MTKKFSEISPKLQWEISLALLKHCAVCLLGLTGLKELKGKHACTHTHIDTHEPRTRSPTITAEAPLYQPKREWWLSLSPQSKMATVPLLSSPIKLPDSFIVLVFDNFLSSVIRSASGSCSMVRAGLWEWQELTWKGTAGWNYSLPWLVKLWARTGTFPELIV